MNRRGVALIAVLWVIALLGVAAAAGLAVARDAVTAGRFRMSERETRWAAEGCLNRARWAAERRLAMGGGDPASMLPSWVVGDRTCAFTIERLGHDPVEWWVSAHGMVRERWVLAGRRVAVVGRMVL